VRVGKDEELEFGVEGDAETHVRRAVNLTCEESLRYIERKRRQRIQDLLWLATL